MKCEVCKQSLNPLKIDNNNILDKCSSCSHIQRDLVRCPAAYRENAWGGDSFFDKTRLFLTWISFKKHLKKYGTPKKIFEIGFGNGFMLQKMIKSKIDIAGCESGMLEVPVSSLIKSNSAIYFDSIENIKLDENSFDFIYAIHVIEHLNDINLAFKKIYQSLKKDKTVYFVTPNGDSKALKWFKSAWWNLEDPTHIRFFSKKSIEIALHNAGFKEIKISIPRLDSLTVEALSLLRLLFNNQDKKAVLHSVFSKLVVVVILPVFLVIRVFVKELAPSFIVTAAK